MMKILDHFWIKIIALILGILLWLHVATDRHYNYQMNLPINEIVLDSNLTLAQKPPESLTVTVSATGKQLIRQKWRERGLKIIANQFRPGRHSLTLSPSNTLLSSPISDLTLKEIISPSHFDLLVDRQASIPVKVQVDVITEPGDGFAVSSISSPVPDEVTVWGPQTIIRRIKEISTERKELKGLRNNIDLTLPLVTPDLYGISLDPDSVSVIIEVVPVKTRQFDNIPIVVYNIPSNRKVTVIPDHISIEISGPPADIDLLNKNAIIASTDYKQMSPDGRTPLKIDCPVRYNVKNISTDSVTLSLE